MILKIHRQLQKSSGLIVQRFKTANPSVYVYLAERQQNRYMHETASKARVSQSALSTHPKYHPGCTRVHRRLRFAGATVEAGQGVAV